MSSHTHTHTHLLAEDRGEGALSIANLEVLACMCACACVCVCVCVCVCELSVVDGRGLVRLRLSTDKHTLEKTLVTVDVADDLDRRVIERVLLDQGAVGGCRR